MSHPQHSASLSCSFQATDLTAIAAMLKEAAQALLNYDQPSETELLEEDSEPENISGPTEQGYTRGEFHDECRCVRLPGVVVRREYELLRERQLEKFSQLAYQVYEDFFAAILLMRHLDAGAELSSSELSLRRQNLSRPLALPDAIGSQRADCELIQKTIVPAQLRPTTHTALGNRACQGLFTWRRALGAVCQWRNFAFSARKTSCLRKECPLNAVRFSRCNEGSYG